MKHAVLVLVVVASIIVGGARSVLASGHEAAVLLEAAGGSTVSGNALLTAEGAGTRVTLDVVGLAPGASATATLHAGTCAMPSASAAALPALTADESGTATATGLILFRGTENVALADIADGDHLIAVAGPSGVVACGQIPRLTAAAAGNTMPATGAATPGLLAGLLLSAGLLAAGGGLRLQSSRSRSHRD